MRINIKTNNTLEFNAILNDFYPEDYDFAIVFDSVANRKARHKMEKTHRPDLIIKYEDEDINT